MNADLTLIGVYSATPKILMILSAQDDIKPEGLRFLNRRFVDSLTMVYKEFGVIAYEFVGSHRFAILRHGELIVNQVNKGSTEKVHTVLLDLEIDRILPMSQLVAYQSSKFENNAIVKVLDLNQKEITGEQKLSYPSFDKGLTRVLQSESGTYTAFIYTNKLVLYKRGSAGQASTVHSYRGLKVS